MLYFYDDKHNSYRLEILIWCNKEWGYNFMSKKVLHFVLLAIFLIENISLLVNFLTWKNFHRITDVQNNNNHDSKTSGPTDDFVIPM